MKNGKTNNIEKIILIFLILLIFFGIVFLYKTKGLENFNNQGQYCVKFDLIKYELSREDVLINCFNIVTGRFQCTWSINDSSGYISIYEITYENNIPEFIPSSRIDYNCTEYVETKKVIFPEEDIDKPVWDGPNESEVLK